MVVSTVVCHLSEIRGIPFGRYTLAQIPENRCPTKPTGCAMDVEENINQGQGRVHLIFKENKNKN